MLSRTKAEHEIIESIYRWQARTSPVGKDITDVGSTRYRANVARVAYDALEAAGAFTPDQPAAPDEDAVLELALIMHHGPNHPPAYDKACSRCWEGARSAITAGYRRPVDTRPTVSEFVKEIGWSIPVYDGDQAAIDADRIFTVDVMLRKGWLRPDPAPAAEVPVFASEPTDILIAWLSPSPDRWWIDGHSNEYVGYYNDKAVTSLGTWREALVDLCNYAWSIDGDPYFNREELAALTRAES